MGWEWVRNELVWVGYGLAMGWYGLGMAGAHERFTGRLLGAFCRSSAPRTVENMNTHYLCTHPISLLAPGHEAGTTAGNSIKMVPPYHDNT
jgi:hypothetical protein